MRFFIGDNFIKEKKERIKKMLALQVGIDGKKYVLGCGQQLGELLSVDYDVFDVFRVIITEYKEMYRLIRDGMRSEKMTGFVRDGVTQGELHVVVCRPDCGFFDALDGAIFPLKRDRLTINYVKCKKTYVIKPSVVWLRNDLKKIGVIK